MTPERRRQIEEIFQSAMEREPQTRSTWLHEVCGRDDDLRSEVEALLASQDTSVIADEPTWRASGSQFGPYRIEAFLGSGGMGQVYRATDTRLQRSVAVKICEREFTARLEREARAVATFNHRNICTVYDVGPNYLVMEMVEGQTLAQRIQQGRIAPAEAIAIAQQISAALEAAHEKGIIHRDLKPANIKLTPDGVVKVLDFGLAKSIQTGLISEHEEPKPAAMTEAGIILGTARYMSPEQARGQAVDKRADIWAFGVVLYEMLAGECPFRGATASDTLAAVLTKTPDWSAVPREMQRLLGACLEKDAKQRLRDIGDVWRLLEHPSEQPPATLQRRTVTLTAVALSSLIVLTAWVWWRAAHVTLKPPVILDVDLGSKAPSGIRSGADVILSPDGTRLVYLAEGRLFTRLLQEQTAKELPQTEGASAPFFSPDGQSVAFFAQSKLKKVSLSARTVEILCDTGLDPRGGSWGDDGTIVVALDNTGPLSRIMAGRGHPSPITDLTGEDKTHRWPQVLPGGRGILFTAHTSPLAGFDEARITVLDLKKHETKALISGGTYGRYLSTGHLLYVKGGSLFAVPFDAGRLEVRGSPTRIFDHVAYNNPDGSAQFDVAKNGTLVYRTGGGDLVKIEWLEASGATQPLLRTPGEYFYPILSPDGQRLAFVIARGANNEIWTYDWQRDIRSRVTHGELFNTNPCWSPSGRYLLFQGSGGIPPVIGMYSVPADGSAAPERLTKSQKLQFPTSFTPDGGRLAYYEGRRDLGGFDLWTVPVKEDASGLRVGNPEPFLRTLADERHPVFSPDGRWIAYDSNESGIPQVYVISFPGKAHKVQISSEGGAFPMWSQTRSELFFRGGDNRIMVAAYETKGGLFLPQKARVWSAARLAERLSASRNFSMSPDGSRAVALMPEDAAQPESGYHVTFVLNFFDELRRRAGQ
jgi:serine/threonine protein kinase/Tol biopolymer transport system component